ncbi:MAG: hypothetical protein JXB15_03120 [Anaerolineales bacterium]|nr:hypothetical protein [Anaerolineales bacterium]
MRTIRLSLLVMILAVLLFPTSALAQSYLFQLDEQTVHVFWNEDGTASIDYVFVFTNQPFAHPIDYVDVGLPNSSFDTNSISADIDGIMLSDISSSGYQGSGTGVAVGLGQRAIRPGETGRLHVFVGTVRRVLYPDSQKDEYASAVFSPTWFGSQYVQGTTYLSVTFHLPPGVQPEEPRWHEAPSGFPSEPDTGLDENGRVMYTWVNPEARGYEQYKFGASFPLTYVPESAIVRQSFLEMLGLSPDDLIAFTFCCGFIGFIGLTTAASIRSSKRRKMNYMPPVIAIEGHGIKRGLTAIEAAILLEQPLEKIMTMILFSVIKKGAATVRNRDPLAIDVIDPLPEGLHDYEVQFLKAFQEKNDRDRRKALQEMMIALVKNVSTKIKGFSRRETVAYYKDIIERAWAQVEQADTPQVKSARYDEFMEWTMLDREYDDRTRRVFTGGPVYVPMWWPRYDPTYARPVSSGSLIPASAPASTPAGGGLSLPHLPGSDFAASVVGGVQNFSSKVVGNISEFTGGVTNKTNPLPVATSSGRSSGSRSGGGCACACACACAGCACACAGGGR